MRVHHSKEWDGFVILGSERGHRRFYRRFILPDTVDADNVQVSDRYGALDISIPKQARAQPRRIKNRIKVSA